MGQVQKHSSWTLCVAAAVFASVPALAIESELVSPSNPIAAFYQQNATVIDQLEATAKDKAGTSNDRRLALERLRREYHYAAVPTAVSLGSDPDDQIAAVSAQILASAIVMSDHPNSNLEVPPSLSIQQHEAAR